MTKVDFVLSEIQDAIREESLGLRESRGLARQDDAAVRCFPWNLWTPDYEGGGPWQDAELDGIPVLICEPVTGHHGQGAGKGDA
jgi:hypothetical protein